MKKFNINQVLCIIIIILLVVLIYKQTIRNEQFYSVDCSKQDIEKLSGTKGDGYRGCQNRTVSGRLCQKWTEQTPHSHSNSSYEHRQSYWRGKTTAQKDGNDYMNPDGEPEGDWCYTTDKNQRWVYEKQKNSRNKLYHGGEPNDWGGHEDCTHLVKWGTGATGTGLNDIGCHYKLPFICEKEVDDPTSLGSNICLDK